MAEPHQFDYLLAMGFLFAFLDAYSIGANDVANSFATSVSSRSLTLWQAVCLASVAEFLGALLLGSRVTGTVKNGIVPPARFNNDPYVLMLLMTCALISSSTWLTFATYLGMPVSTTHCIIGAIIGGGIASLGWQGPTWGWNGGQGIAAIIASWFIAPLIAGGFAAIIYLLTKYFVLQTKNPLRNGMIAIPIYFGITFGILTMMIVWKGAPNLGLDKLSNGAVAGSVLGVAGVTIIICILWLIPYFRRRLVMEDWTIRWYHIFLGPALLFRGPVPPIPEDVKVQVVQDYYRGHITKEDLQADGTLDDRFNRVMHEVENQKRDDPENGTPPSNSTPVAEDGVSRSLENVDKPQPFYKSPMAFWLFLKRTVLRGMFVEVVEEQTRGGGSALHRALGKNVMETHSRAHKYDNKTEYLYSMLQAFTATTASFAHGSNDVANAVGPLTAIFQIWDTGTNASRLPVPVWVLAFGGAAIVIGLATYGYNIMRNLGNRLTLHSPSRGFSMELGAALTVVLASRLAIPISTTQCIVGATMAVGLCNWDVKAINWRMIGWCYLGWLITLPITSLVSAILMSIILNAPHFGLTT